MKYIVQVNVSPAAGDKVEANPEMMQELLGKWQAHDPIGMYFSISRRRITIILEADNENTFFEALHRTWVLSESYPEVWPVADQSEFPVLLQRLGLAG